LGATYLQEGRFMKAQSVWKEAASNHEGISLQTQKQQAYHYFENCNESLQQRDKGSSTQV